MNLEEDVFQIPGTDTDDDVVPVVETVKEVNKRTYGIGTTIIQTGQKKITNLQTYRKDINPYFQTSFLPPVSCSGCGARLDFLSVYGLLRAGKELIEVYNEVDAQRLCCRQTIIEDPLAVELIDINKMKLIDNDIEKRIYRFEADIIKLTRRISDIYLILNYQGSNDKLKAEMSLKLESSTKDLENVLTEMDQYISSLDEEYYDTDLKGLVDVINSKARNFLKNPNSVFSPNELFSFFDRYSTVNKLNIPGISNPVFDYDGFLVGKKRKGVEEIKEKMRDIYAPSEEDIADFTLEGSRRGRKEEEKEKEKENEEVVTVRRGRVKTDTLSRFVGQGRRGREKEENERSGRYQELIKEIMDSDED